MRSGRIDSSGAMTRMDRSKALPRTLYALVSFGAAVMTVDSGLADSLTATFQQEQYANPRPDQPIFAVTWPGLIAANNEAHAKGFLHNGPPPGKNSSLVLNNAVLTIPGGRVVTSINSGLYSSCHTGSLSQDTAAHAFSCPARVTIYKGGQARTIDAGFLCRVGGDTPDSAARMSYDPVGNALHFYAVIGGARVPFSNTDEPCDRTISLAQ
jgi:hypothetical protein